MATSTLTIRRDLRHPLRMAALLELSSGAEQMDGALAHGDAHAMRASRARFETAARFLDDLGWAENDTRVGFDITISTERLLALLERIDRTTSQALIEHARTLRRPPSRRETPLERHDRLTAMHEYCDQDLDMRTAALALRTAVEAARPRR